eukprot:766872-Hanusia_phi.AAC.2
MSVWAIAFIQYWDKREAELLHIWGLKGFEHDEQPRKEFKGERRVDPYTDLYELHREKGKMWEWVSLLFYLVSIAACIAFGLSILISQGVI